MSLTLNMVGGGGGKLKNTDAILSVTVPTGSAITATKGAVTLTPTMWAKADDNTLDVGIFIIHASQFDSNPWTVTATLGTKTKSTTIVINSAKEYSITLLYDYYIVKNGILQIPTSDFQRSGSSAGFISQGSSYVQFSSGNVDWVVMFRTANPVDLTNFSTYSIHVVNGRTWGSTGNAALIGIGVNAPSVPSSGTVVNVTAYTMISGTGSGLTFSNVTKNMDVTNYTGLYYLCVTVSYTQGSAGYLNVDDWHLV